MLALRKACFKRKKRAGSLGLPRSVHPGTISSCHRLLNCQESKKKATNEVVLNLIENCACGFLCLYSIFRTIVVFLLLLRLKLKCLLLLSRNIADRAQVEEGGVE